VLLNTGSIGPTPLSTNTAPMYVGNNPIYRNLPGMWVDDVRVYDTALTAAELDEVRLSNVPEPAAGLALVVVGLAGTVLRKRRCGIARC
jgi:hypothetical protein